jgi:hypothetical protein
MDEYKIVERVKDWYRAGLIKAEYNLLLNDMTIISEKSYKRSYKHNPSISKQVIGHVNNYIARFIFDLEFPMFLNWDFILDAYLHKIGYVFRGYSPLGPAPLPNLKYIIHSITGDTEHMSSTGYDFQDKLVIELVDLDVVANNLNLPKIVSSVLGSKLLSENNIIEPDEFNKIDDRIISQKLFAGHAWNDAELIVGLYFDRNQRELLKEVFKISVAYERVFRPYRVVYNTKTWQPVLV